MIHADAGDRVFHYRARGDLAGAIEANNRLVTYSYDALSRLTEVAVDGGVVERRF
jgi:YD repeat-containing protein